MLKKLWMWLKSHPLHPAIAVCVFAQVADVVSSSLHGPGIEQNPFARYPDGQFWVWHGIVGKFLFGAIFGLVSWAIYEVSRRFDKNLAAILASLPLFYFTWDVLQAAVGNLMLYWGWYQELATKNPFGF